jgi:hypothetical protein
LAKTAAADVVDAKSVERAPVGVVEAASIDERNSILAKRSPSTQLGRNQLRAH